MSTVLRARRRRLLCDKECYCPPLCTECRHSGCSSLLCYLYMYICNVKLDRRYATHELYECVPRRGDKLWFSVGGNVGMNEDVMKCVLQRSYLVNTVNSILKKYVKYTVVASCKLRPCSLVYNKTLILGAGVVLRYC